MHFTDHDNDTPIVSKPVRGLANLLHLSRRPVLMLAPAPASDGDELLENIERERQNDTIVLEERPDTDQLDAYWTKVHDDLEQDPNWFKFAED